MLSEVEVGIARQHIATAIKERRCDFVTRCQLLADRLFADLLRYDGRVVELMPTVFTSPKTELAIAQAQTHALHRSLLIQHTTHRVGLPLLITDSTTEVHHPPTFG